MALNIINTNYNGEVLNRILLLATTSNELVERGLIHVIPGVNSKIAIPRMKIGKVLQKRVPMPTSGASGTSKGNHDYSEQTLEPKDMMVYTEFNPSTFEHIWREFQPVGRLVFHELPPNVQSVMLEALLAQVNSELGEQFITGTFGSGATQLMNGILTRIKAATGVIKPTTTGTTSIIGMLEHAYKSIPKAIRKNPNLKFLMSVEDWDTYNAELIARDYKNINETDANVSGYRGIKIEALSAWPQGDIVTTVCSPDLDSNLFAAVNLVDDMNVIEIDKVAANGEMYFFKMLMKADTNVAFGEEIVLTSWTPSTIVAPVKASGGTPVADPTAGA